MIVSTSQTGKSNKTERKINRKHESKGTQKRSRKLQIKINNKNPKTSEAEPEI